MLRLKSKEIFVASPGEGVGVSAICFYTQREGPNLMSIYSYHTRSDISDISFHRFSHDNGQTWSSPEEVQTFQKVARGTRRRYIQPGFVDPVTGRLVFFILCGLLPTDNPLEGLKQWTLKYGISRDGGRSLAFEEPVIQRGSKFSEEHPMEGVWTGKNAAMVGDSTQLPLTISTGEILLPVQITPIGPDGHYYNPGGGYTYHYVAVLIGRWDGHGISWDISEPVEGDPARSTRGMIEPTIAQMPDGRILMVMRGSNDRKPELSGYRWWSVSHDLGRTWSQPEPWRYTHGEAFYSPSSCSQLLSHSNGRYYWIGNISNENPRGNRPRYPLFIGEVDPETLCLKRDTLCVIDDKRPEDSEQVTFSNFHAREDRFTGDILVYCTPFFSKGHWTSDAYEYRIGVDVQ